MQEKRKQRDINEMMQITKFLRRPQIYLLLYGYVTMRREVYPNENWGDSIRQFKIKFGIHDEIECDEIFYRQVFLMTADLLNEGI